MVVVGINLGEQQKRVLGVRLGQVTSVNDLTLARVKEIRNAQLQVHLRPSSAHHSSCKLLISIEAVLHMLHADTDRVLSLFFSILTTTHSTLRLFHKLSIILRHLTFAKALFRIRFCLAR